MTTATKTKKHTNNGNGLPEGPPGGFRDVNREHLAAADRLKNGEPVGSAPADHSDHATVRGSPDPAHEPTEGLPTNNRRPAVAKSGGVGRPAPSALSDRRLERIPIEFLGPSPWQPRTEFDQAKLQELAQSIQLSGGNITPCIVWQVSGSYIVEHTTRGNGKKLPQYFVLAGERRLRACQWGVKHGLPCCASLTCEVFEGKPSDAERLARLENLHREDLTPLDAIRNLKRLLEAGAFDTQAQLAAAVGLSPAALSNQLRVLELPKDVLDLISQEIIGPTHLRALVPFKDRPAVIAELLKDAKQCAKNASKSEPWRPTVGEFERFVINAVDHVSRPVRCGQYGEYVGQRWVGKDVFPTDATIKKNAAALQIEETSLKGLGERCFNVKLWDELQAARVKERAEKVDRPTKAGNTKTLTKAEVEQRNKQQAEQLHKRLYRYRLAWLQRRIGEQIREASIETCLQHVLAWCAAADEGHRQRAAELGEAIIEAGGSQKCHREEYGPTTPDPWASLATLDPWQPPREPNGSTASPHLPAVHRAARDVLARWYQHTCEGYRADLKPAFIEHAAVDLNIDMAKEWKLDEGYLVLLSKEQILAHVAEWKLTFKTMPGISAHQIAERLPTYKRGALCAAILQHSDADRKASFPKLLAKLKPVRLL